MVYNSVNNISNGEFTMKRFIKQTIITLLNPISPIITLLIGWLLSILVTEPKDKFPCFINFLIVNPFVIIAFVVFWLFFSVIYTEQRNVIRILKKENDEKDEIIKEKETQLNHTSGIILNRSGDFANFNRQLRFNDALYGFVHNNTLVESAQIYSYSIKRMKDNIIIRVLYDSSCVYENVDINNLAQTYYEINYSDYTKIKDIILIWKELSTNSIGSFREKDALINTIISDIEEIFKKYYNELNTLSSVDEVNTKHFTKYRILTLLIRLARRLSTTTMDNKILSEDKKDIENYLLNGKRTGILNSILLEDIFMFKYTRNSHKKNGRAYVSFHAKISNQNYIIVFSVQTSDLDKYTDLEQEITNLKKDFIYRITKNGVQN